MRIPRGAVLKKLSAEQKLRSIRLAQLRAKNRERRREARSFRKNEDAERVVHAPEDLSFSRNYANTVAFLEEMRRVVLSARGKVHIDLVPVRHISVPAAIVLAAEFHRWSLIRKSRLRPRSISKWAPRLRALLSDLGVFELLGIPAFTKRRALADNFTLTQLKSGVRAEGSKLNALQQDFDQIIKGFTRNPELYAGLQEATENVVAHAYPNDIQLPYRSAGHRWWGVGCLQPAEERLRFFIFDQGAGIPATLPRSEWYEQVRAVLITIFGKWVADDGKLILAALETGRTQTQQPHRGKGLARMCNIVLANDRSYIRIISGRGEVTLKSDASIAEITRSSHIGGTLIEWSIPADVFTVEDDDASHQ